MDIATTINFISTIVSLVVALVSLVVSLVALKISRKVLIYSSKDYIPEFEYFIGDNDDLKIKNNSKDLFSIKHINFVKIITIGFENYENHTITQIPFITKSTLWWWIDDSQEVYIAGNDTGACAYQICPYDKNVIKEIRNKVQSEYSIDSKKGYASPSLQSVKYVLEIVYENAFKEKKSVVFLKQHIHSQGFDNSKISDEQLTHILERSNLPKFDSTQELWQHVVANYTYSC